MTQEGGTPPGFWERIQQMIDRAVAGAMRSGMLRNASITDGGLTIKGGFLRLLSAVTGGVATFYVGPVNPPLPDGSYQPGVVIRREDGTVAMALFDPIPDPASPDGYKQFLAIYDRTGNVVFSDDTDSGQGHARPYVPGVGYPAQSRHWPDTTAAAWETLYRVRMPKQQPKLFVQAWGTCDTAGTTGEIRVMVNGNQLGTTKAVATGTVQEFLFGPTAVGGSYNQALNVELQAQRTGGAGVVRACFSWVQGEQS